MTTPAQAPTLPAPAPAPTPRYAVSIYPGTQHPVPETLADAIRKLEASLGMPVWMLIQDGDENNPFGEINDAVRNGFFDARTSITSQGPVALLVDSPGGDAKAAYQIASIFRQQCKGFTAIVPRYAKSAATLLVLGASDILLNKYAELGPLDAQILDFEREQWASALDEVQSLDRLHAFGLEALDQTMFLLVGRTKKKMDFVLPHALNFIVQVMRPMLEKVDVVHYTQRARVLKVAEEYAIRLLKPKYPHDLAVRMARSLVEKYPEHDFAIDSAELTQIGIQNTSPTDEQIQLMDATIPHLGHLAQTYIGRLQEIPNV